MRIHASARTFAIQYPGQRSAAGSCISSCTCKRGDGECDHHARACIGVAQGAPRLRIMTCGASTFTMARSHSAALPTRSPTPKARLLETDAHVVIFSAPICRIVDSVRPHATSWMRSLCTPTHSSGCPRRIVGKHQPAQQINPEPWDPVALVTEPSLSSVFGASSWFSAPP